MEKRSFKSGQIIIKEGALDNCAYLILSGKVEVSKLVNNQKVIIDYLGKNEIFGELSLFDNKPRSATIVASENSECVVFYKQPLDKELSRMDKWAQSFFKIIVDRLRRADFSINPIGDLDYFYSISYIIYLLFKTDAKKDNNNHLLSLNTITSKCSKMLNPDKGRIELVISKLSTFLIVEKKILEKEPFLVIKNPELVLTVCNYYRKIIKNDPEFENLLDSDGVYNLLNLIKEIVSFHKTNAKPGADSEFELKNLIPKVTGMPKEILDKLLILLASEKIIIRNDVNKDLYKYHIEQLNEYQNKINDYKSSINLVNSLLIT